MAADTAVVLNPTRLVIAALIGLVILLVLIIKCKVQAMVAILIGALVIGLGAGMSFEDIISAVNDGIGNACCETGEAALQGTIRINGCKGTGRICSWR